MTIHSKCFAPTLRLLEFFKKLKCYDIFDDVIIANEVEDELLAGGKSEGGKTDFKEAINKLANVKEVKNKLALESLMVHIGKGEAASILLYLEINADLLAINDLKARGIALAMGVKIIGTLGILRLAKDRGMLKQIKPLLSKLKKAGAYISDNLYNRILKDAGEI